MRCKVQMGVSLAFIFAIGGAAHGQCGGDCNDNKVVSIDELVTGVNIVLGTEAYDSCKNLDRNDDGRIAINELVGAVNNALGTCPPPIGEHTCTLGPGSQIALYGALPLPPLNAEGGTARITGGATGPGGKASAECGVIEFPPLSIGGIFWACINPATAPCAAREFACEGGAPLGVNLYGTHNVGLLEKPALNCTVTPDDPLCCTGNADCAAKCATLCGGADRVFLKPQCEGFCQGGTREDQLCQFDTAPANARACSVRTCSVTSTQACVSDSECPPGQCSVTSTQPCAKNADCPQGETCVNPEKCALAATCSVDADCAAGGLCVGPGQCSVTERSCTKTSDCPEGEMCKAPALACPEGSCNGQDNVPLGHVCDCNCIEDAVGAAGDPGTVQCQLAFNLTVEGVPGNGLACDGADVTINVGDTCAPLTTQTVKSIMDNANGAAGTRIPTLGVCSGGTNDGKPCRGIADCPGAGASCPTVCAAAPTTTCTTDADCGSNGPCGAYIDSGTPIACSAVQSDDLSGLQLRGAAIFYGSTIGDLVAALRVNCQ